MIIICWSPQKKLQGEAGVSGVSGVPGVGEESNFLVIHSHAEIPVSCDAR